MNLEQIGLGMLLTKIDYIVTVARTPFAYGFRVRTLARFRKCTESQRKCIDLWALSQGMDFTGRKQVGGKMLDQLIETLEPFYSLMNPNDVNGIKKILWMRENPMPRVSYKEDGTRRSRKIGKNWKKFMYWVEAWDAFCEGLE